MILSRTWKNLDALAKIRKKNEPSQGSNTKRFMTYDVKEEKLEHTLLATIKLKCELLLSPSSAKITT